MAKPNEGLLSALYPEIRRQLLIDEKKRKYVHDPAAWAWEILGVQLWSKQRQIADAVRTTRRVAVAAGHGVGKDLPLDTPIATPTGWSTVGDLRVGDQVYDEAGTPCRVVGKSEVFNLPLFRTTFSDGSSVVSSASHEWATIDHSAAKKARRAEGGVSDWRNHWGLSEVRETQDIRGSLTYQNGAKAGANHIIPNAGALVAPERELPIDPYVTGAWLGDGTSSAATMTIGNDGLFIIEEFAKAGYTLTKTKAPYGYTFARQGALQLLRGADLMNNKHIPSDYQRASIPQRKELLRGLMDTDGFVAHGTICGIDLMNQELAYDTVELIRGLGVRASITPSRTYLDGRDVGTRYRIVFNPTWSPFTGGQYKDEKWGMRGSSFISQSRRTMRTIVSVEPVPTVPTQCIEVDSDSHLYLATENLIPTHNSYVAGVICMWWWDTHPLLEDETFVATTAPSKDQVDLIWANIRIFHSRMKLRHEQGLIDHSLPGYITGDNKFKMPDGQTLGQGRKPPDSKSDIAFQGRHATYLLAIGDEAVGLTEGFLNALEVIAVGKHNVILLLANPTDPSCAMARIWPDPEGRGGSAGWERIHISVHDSPLITKEPGFDTTNVTGMAGEDFLRDAEELYGGKDDPRYIARVLGQWAWDNGVGLFPEEVIARAMRTVVVPDAAEPKRRLGVDVARMGRDATQVYECQEGWVWETDPETNVPTVNTGVKGLYIRYVEGWNKAPVTSTNLDNLGSAQRIDLIAKESGIGVINVDAGGGLGAGLFDAMEEMWFDSGKMPLYETFMIYGNDMKNVDRRAYLNLRAMMFSEMKRRMNAGEIDFDAEDFPLLEELRGVRAKVVNGSVLQIESKEDMKNRGAKSPDRADAVWYSMVDSLGDPDGPLAPGEVRQLDPYDIIGDVPEFYRASTTGW